MSVTSPPRPPRPSDPVTHGEFDALVEALIEEARQRARRRRRRYGAVALVVAAVAIASFIGFGGHGGGGAGAAPPARAPGMQPAAADAQSPRLLRSRLAPVPRRLSRLTRAGRTSSMSRARTGAAVCTSTKRPTTGITGT